MSPDEEWLLKAIEEVLNKPLLPQWLPGYEPDLNKPLKNGRRKQSAPSKKSARKKALTPKPRNRKR